MIYLLQNMSLLLFYSAFLSPELETVTTRQCTGIADMTQDIDPETNRRPYFPCAGDGTVSSPRRKIIFIRRNYLYFPKTCSKCEQARRNNATSSLPLLHG